jgi:hypothetical protein
MEQILEDLPNNPIKIAMPLGPAWLVIPVFNSFVGLGAMFHLWIAYTLIIAKLAYHWGSVGYALIPLLAL